MQFPDQAYEASIRGLNIWWEIVFPSLLPFFITAELLLSFGVVKFLGVLFEPIMRPLFNVPGAGSFPWLMGMASGYPTGAKITTRLREEGQVNQFEGERLVAFTNASSPLFIFGAISVGFFHDVKLGVLLASSHYAANLLVGLTMRFHPFLSRNKKQTPKKHSRPSIQRAFREMHRTRIKDSRPFGEVLGDAVLHSIQTLVMVGGFIILFSVLTKLFFMVRISPIIASILKQIFDLVFLPVDLAMPFLTGIFEITLGIQMMSKEVIDPFLAKLVLVSFILGFNGFSVQAQVASIIAKTDIRFMPYFAGRLFHSFYAAFLTILLYKPLYLNRQAFDMHDMPVTSPIAESNWGYLTELMGIVGPIITICALLVAVMILLTRK